MQQANSKSIKRKGLPTDPIGMEFITNRKIIGLVLGSGASRGWAHIGAIEALEEENIPIDLIVGCSIGSYVGALYAAGSMKSLKEFVLKMDGRKVFSYFDVVFPRSGILNGTKKLKELFSMHTDKDRFSDLKLPVMMVATDLETGGKVVLKSGNLLTALRATMSIPGIFAPARVGSRWLVDGGLVDPVPVSVARAQGADIIIAIDLNGRIVSREDLSERLKTRIKDHHGYKNDLIQKLTSYYENAETGFKRKISELLHRESSTPDIMETVTSSITIMQNRITRINLAVDPPDILIQPRLGGLKMLEFNNVENVIREGYLRVKRKIQEIKNLLQPVNQQLKFDDSVDSSG
ncbi:MAG: patatin-like phospholipase family protein [Thermodesulfobacteriota bacterium]